MNNPTHRDIVIDTNVMRLYDKPKDNNFKLLFVWLRKEGALTISKKLLAEYGGTKNDLIFVLINELNRDGRYRIISNSRLNYFKFDSHYKYTCNQKDIWHARLVFLSFRKRLVSFDDCLVNDVNKFRKIDGIKPNACKRPIPVFYK